MDTTYVKMCDCDEIQEQEWTIDEDEFATPEIDGEPTAIWLPTQSQLQGMVRDIIDCPSHSSCAIFINVGHRIRRWCDDAWDYWMQFTSMEQLWLAFVMKEKWDKVWVNEKWVILPNKGSKK